MRFSAVKKFSILFVCFLFVVLHGLAVEPYSVEKTASIKERWRWTELEAISGHRFNFAQEGPNGSIWFAGGCNVACYDGKTLKSFPLDRTNAINRLLVARDGRVFVSVNVEDYVLVGERWVKLEKAFGEFPVRGEFVENIDGSVWVGNRESIFRIKGDSVLQFSHPLSVIHSMACDMDGNLWITDFSSDSIYVLSTSDLTNQSLKVIKRMDFDLPKHHVKLFCDSKNRMWVLWPDKNGRCYFYQNFKKQIGVEGLDETFRDALDLEIAEFPEGSFWFSVRHKLANLKNETLNLYSESEYPVPTSSSFITTLSGDRLLIGGAESKTYIVDLSSHRWLSYANLNFQCEDHKGAYWFLEHDGCLVTDNAGAHWQAFEQTDGIIDTPNRVICASDGTLWVSGSHQGDAAVAHRENGSWSRNTFPELGSIISHLSVHESEDGSIYFGCGILYDEKSGGKGGVVVFKKVDGRYFSKIVFPPVFPSRVSVLVEGKTDELWLGGDWLYSSQIKKNSTPERVKLFQDKYWIDHLAVDQNKDLWVAVWGKGIYRLRDSSWTHFNEMNGLVNNEVIFLKAGTKHGLWTLTSSGLSRFDGVSWSQLMVPWNKKFLRESHTLEESSDGAIWINHAYRSWLLEGVKDAEFKKRFSAIRYKGSKMNPETEIVEFQSHLPEGSPVHLKWKGADQWSETPADELEFSWKFDNSEWSGYSRKNSVVLYDIGSGNHSFEVRSRDGDWNIDLTPAKVEIHVTPPMWRRPWFILLVVAVFGLIAFLVNRLFEARVKAALAMEEFKLDFFTNISHELKTPLSVIMGPLEMQLREERMPAARRRLKIALRNAQKMKRLVEQLLQFRKIEIGKQNLNPNPGELISFLKEAIEGNATLWKDKDQRVKIETNETNCLVAYDQEKLQKIVDNLLTNAIKYSDEESFIRVLIDVKNQNDEKFLKFTVEDEGYGIPPHEMDHIFKPFYRVNANKQKKEGFGLGLTIVNELVQIWDGKIELQSPVVETGKGTRVTVCLPLQEADETSESASNVDLVDVEVETDSVKNCRILIVEDNTDLRHFMRDELSDRYRITEAENGLDGFKFATEENPDLIITDVMMDGMNGFELCRKLRMTSDTSHIPIIILTAKSSEEHYLKGAEVGADAYFSKPISLIRLIAQIENLLETRRNLKMRFSEQLVIEPTELTIIPGDQEFIRKAIEIVETHIDDSSFGVDQFAREISMGRSTLLAKLKALTGQTPNSFIRSIRMKRAVQLLESGKYSISEIIEFVGIQCPSYFSRAFKKEFGVTPSQYKSDNVLKKTDG